MVMINGYAKINLLLDILGQREDGYHEIATVMQSLALADTLTLTKQETGITLTVDLPGLEADERNLAYRAAALLMRECGVRGGVHIRIDKRIPVAAGLAGGSADAAAALRGVNELYALGQSDAELCRLGALIGSDVPFSLMGGTALATGRGEVLEHLPAVFDFPVVLAKPPVAVSTPWAYRSYDANPPTQHPDRAAFLRALRAGDTAACLRMAANVLEPITEAAHPVVGDYRARLRAAEMMRQETDADVHLTHTMGQM